MADLRWYAAQALICLDTANLQEIRKAISWGCFSGVTTNPVILSHETKDYKQHVQKILKLISSGWPSFIGLML
jgi:transaldolase